MMITKAQKIARRRNFGKRQLRGMIGQLKAFPRTVPLTQKEINMTEYAAELLGQIEEMWDTRYELAKKLAMKGGVPTKRSHNKIPW